jgi:signal transduction histidine kinase
MISAKVRSRTGSSKSVGKGEVADDEFFAGGAVAALTRELANPLNDMHTLTGLMEHYLQKKMGGDRFLSVTVRNLTSEISRLKVLLEEFRLLVRPQELDFCAVDLAELAGEFLQSSGLDFKGIRVEKFFSRPLPPVRADRGKLRDVLHSLVTNSVEAMPDGGPLTLRAWADARNVRLDVEDMGMGIPDGLNVFEPFVTTKRNGTGLGLTIARQITAAHGGTLTYCSRPGAGATFSICFPPARQPAES